MHALRLDKELRSGAVREARRELWRRRLVWPLLHAYLDRDQLEDMRAFMQGGDAERGVLPGADWYDDVGRQRGKSYKWTVFDVVWAHCHRGQQLKYLAQSGVSVRGIVMPVIHALFEDMPEEMRPTHSGEESIREDRQDHKWHFPHRDGAAGVLHATGCNNQHYKALRGPRAHKIVQDECAFYDDFDSVQSALRPMLITTGGPCVYATTPAESPDHPSESACQALKAAGRYVHRTINNHPRLSRLEIDRLLTKEAAAKGMTLAQFKATTYYRREYLAMHVVEETRAVVPEWSWPAGAEHPEGTTWGDAHTAVLPRPLFAHTYEGFDIGFTRDPSAWIGGYWDWDNARLVVEAETPPLHRNRAEELAAAILERRRHLWPTKDKDGRPMPPPFAEAQRSPCGTYWLSYKAMGDGAGNGAEKLDELAREGVRFLHADKADLEARVNRLKTLVAQGKLWMHPSCVYLRRQLASGLWADRGKTDFERRAEGHLDHLSALVDLVGHIERDRCPVPQGYGIDSFNTATFQPKRKDASVKAIESVLGRISWE